jgi:hypothetical protein
VKIDKFPGTNNWYWSFWVKQTCLTMHDGFGSPKAARDDFEFFGNAIKNAMIFNRISIRRKQ